MKKGDPPIVVEESFDASVDTVWRAISDVQQMRQWYFENIPAFEAEVGFETHFDVGHEGRVFPHRWNVTRVVPARTLEYRWRFDGYPGDSAVIFDLVEQDGRTNLRLTARIDESFPEDVPEFTRESGIAGWQYLINQSLKDFLAKAQ